MGLARVTRRLGLCWSSRAGALVVCEAVARCREAAATIAVSRTTTAEAVVNR